MSLNLLNQNDNSLADLVDWPQIASILSSLAYFFENKIDLSRVPCAIPRNVLLDELETMDQYLSLVHSQGHMASILGPLAEDSPPQRDLVTLLNKEQALDFNELNKIALLIESYSDYQLVHQELPANLTFIPIDNIKDLLKTFLKPFRRFVEVDGNVDYTRHPELREVTQDINQIEKKIRAKLDQMIRSDKYKNNLQYDQYDIYEQYFVLAVKSDSFQREMGRIVSRSARGHTLLVEPFEIRELSSERQFLINEREKKIARITLEMSKTLSLYQNDINTISQALKLLDSLNAKSILIERFNLIRPEIAGKPVIRLKDFFHPLIEQCVPNTIELLETNRGAILSGPNAGGKTIALKSIALSHLFIHKGLFVPAKSASIYPFQEIYYFGSDEQNIELGLSSFTAETSQYLNLLNEVDEPALVLIDEIFSSTSSEEASALAISLLDLLTAEHSAKCILSSHHQILKSQLHGDKSYLSGHVVHDHETQSATYKISWDGPGASLALEIFSSLANHFGIGEDIPKQAKELLGKSERLYETLLHELSQQKSKYHKLITENDLLNKELKNQKDAMRGLLEIEKSDLYENYKQKITAIYKEALDFKDSLKKGSRHSVDTIIKSRDNILDKLPKTSRDKKPKTQQQIKLNAEQLIEGNIYFCNLLNCEVKLTKAQVKKGKVTVSSKGKSIVVPVESLSETKRSQTPPLPKVRVNIHTERLTNLKLDARGMRLSQFEAEVEKALLDLLNGSIPFLEVVHGHGDGILKTWLRDSISKKDDFYWEIPKGNDGATVIKLN